MLETTRYKKNIHKLDDYQFKVLKKSTNKKLGKKILKGQFKGYKFHTLTLVERESCPKDCFHWKDCFGNNMPFAHRFSSEDELLLTTRIHQDIKDLKGKFVMIRLHILGDFFNVQYVYFWDLMLTLYPNIAIYGYTANSTSSKLETSRNIAQAILSLRIKHKKRFSVRFSNDLTQEFSANSEELQTPQILQISPYQDIHWIVLHLLLFLNFFEIIYLHTLLHTFQILSH